MCVTQEFGGGEAEASPAVRGSAQAYNDVYDALLSHGFQRPDIEEGMLTQPRPDLPATLDWLCTHVPPTRLPDRFAGAALAPLHWARCSLEVSQSPCIHANVRTLASARQHRAVATFAERLKCQLARTAHVNLSDLDHRHA